MRVTSNADPVMNSTVAGAAIGAMGGPIGLGIGAILGYVHGVGERERLQQEARSEMDRQQGINQELERQIETKKGLPRNGSGTERGLIVLADHLSSSLASPEGSRTSEDSSAGEGLILLADHLAPKKAEGPQQTSQSKIAGGPQAMEKKRPTSKDKRAAPASTERSRTSGKVEAEGRDQKMLEEEILRERERRQKILAQLNSPSPSQEKLRAATPPPEIDPEGFRSIYEQGRLVRKERDVNGDGKADLLRYFDEMGRFVRQEEDSRLTGRIDAWSFYENGRLLRKESDTNGDGRVDLWAFYDDKGELIRTEADQNQDGHRELVSLYVHGEMVEEQHFRRGLDTPRMIITYVKGQPTRKAEDTDGDRRMDRVTEYDAKGRTTKISQDPGKREFPTLFAYYQPETGKLLREEEDLNGDGRIDVVSYFERGRLIRREFFDLPEIASLKPPLALPKMPSAKETP
jgi:antitoxin component YwqK of YwqJK toxin-antitoxin module